MSEQKKPKIDLKARLGKKTVAAPGGPAIPPPVGIPKPPAMGGVSPSQPPRAMGGYGAVMEAAPPPPRVIEPQSIKVEMSEEVIEQQKKIQRRGYITAGIVSVIVGFIGFTFGGSHERDKGANAAIEGARDLVKEIQASDKVADDLNDLLAKTSARLGKSEYPQEEIGKLGDINIPFDGGHLTGKGMGRFKRDLVVQLIAYANMSQKANDQKEKLQNLLSGTKAALTDILAQKTDPKVHWGVWLENTPNGPWANMQPLPAAFLVSSKEKVKDKDGKEQDYAWPADIQVPNGKEKVTLKRYKSGDIMTSDPQFVPVAPQSESVVCPSTTIVRIRQELMQMQTILKGDETPGNEKTGLLQMGDQVIASLKKLLQGV